MADGADRTGLDRAGSGRETSPDGTGTRGGQSRRDEIALADAIASVRDQLIDAATRATDSPLAFEVGAIDMEFTLEFRRETKGGARIKALVVEAGGDGARSTARTHRVAFTLTPHPTGTDAPWQVGNPDPGDTSHFGTR